jgi:DNA polymerase-3 subunit gamma/tau
MGRAKAMTNTQETRIETYIPLYRKYRPQAFADVVGQEAIVQTLGNAIQLSKVAHAYLLCGPRGTGKTSTARIFAKSLNCEQGPTVTPCLQCASCMGIAQGNALDVIEFDAASNNGVGDARELIENCQYSSMTGRFKVYIIDEVHMLTPQAFNALLKTLEEPPPNVIFIFATTEAHKVLPTIISRCQRFDFNRITTDSIVHRLRYIAEQESIIIDDEALLMIARHARGGLRDAVGLLDQVAVLGRANPGKTIGRKDVALFIGTLEEELLLRLSRAIAERQASALLADLNELMNRGIEPIQLLKDLTVHFRNLLLVQAAGPQSNPDALSLPQDYFNALVEQTALFPEPEEIPQIIGRMSFIERNIRHGSQPSLWLEVGLLELAYRHEIYQVKELSERVARLEAQLSGQLPPMASAPPSKPMQASAAPAQPARAPQAAMASPTQGSQQAETPAAPARTQPETRVEPVGQVLSQMAGATAAPHADNAPASGQASLPLSGVTAVGRGSLEADYRQICAGVPSLTMRSLLQQQAFPLSFADDVLTIGIVSEPNLAVLKKPDRFIHLQKAVEKYYGRPIRVDLTVEKNRPVPTLAEIAPASPKAPPAPAHAVVSPPPSHLGASVSEAAMRPSSSTNGGSLFGDMAPYGGAEPANAPSGETSAFSTPPAGAMSAPQTVTMLAPAPVASAPRAAMPAMSMIASGPPIDFSAPPKQAESGAAIAVAEPPVRTTTMPSSPVASSAQPETSMNAGNMPNGNPQNPSASVDMDAPPMDSGEPGPNVDGDDMDFPSGLATSGGDAASGSENAALSISAGVGGDPELLEAKKHALELLQGKLVE